MPLLLATGNSQLSLEGGTHVAWSPPFHYLEKVYLPTLRRMGFQARVEIERWGWYPIGGGVMTALITGIGHDAPDAAGVDLTGRGDLKTLRGTSALSNLPRHIAERQKHQVEKVLGREGFDPQVAIVEAPSRGRGSLVFLLAEFDHVRAGFTSLGRRGKPAEKVAEEACADFLHYYQSGAAVDQHLADQLIVPMALAEGRSSFTTCRITRHLLTNVSVVERFLKTESIVEGEEGRKGKVTISGRNSV
jgi:RNA 3'-terminal phosphate cyclase (ATP)